MNIDEYLDNVCGRIKWRAARAGVREELRGHLCDKAAEYEAAGATPAEAEAMAVRDMGDGDSLGAELSRVNRPAAYPPVLVCAALTVAAALAFTESWAQLVSLVLGGGLFAALYFADVMAFARHAPLLFGAGTVFCVTAAAARQHLDVSWQDAQFTFFLAAIMLVLAGMCISRLTGRQLIVFGLCLGVSALSLAVAATTAYALLYVLCVGVMLAQKYRAKGVACGVALAVLTAAALAFHYGGAMARRIRPTDSWLSLTISKALAGSSAFGPGAPTLLPNEFGENALPLVASRAGLIPALLTALTAVLLVAALVRMAAGTRGTARTVITGTAVFFGVNTAYNLLMTAGVVMPAGAYVPFVMGGVWQTLAFGMLLGCAGGLYRRKHIKSGIAALS